MTDTVLTDEAASDVGGETASDEHGFAFGPEDLMPLPTFRAAYSDRAALAMAWLCQCAYIPFETGSEAREQLARTLKAGGFELLGAFNFDPTADGVPPRRKGWVRRGAQAFLAQSKAFAVLAFRGTTAATDWRTNRIWSARRIPLGDHEIRVHKGFHQALEQIEDDVQSALAPIFEARARPLYVTGHSLGGALAQIATARFSHDVIAACYSFGAPRVADEAFELYVKPPHYRVVNAADIVPTVPISIPFTNWRYAHMGDPRHLLGEPGRLSRRARRALFYARVHLKSFLGRGFGSDYVGVRDHAIGEYIRRLANIAGARRTLTQGEAPEAGGVVDRSAPDAPTKKVVLPDTPAEGEPSAAPPGTSSANVTLE